jgi:hypothetical protein
MKKKLPCSQPCRDVSNVLDTAYVVLPDDRVARLLKPTLQNGKNCYNIFIDGEYTRLTVDALRLTPDELRQLIAERRKKGE